MINPMDLTGKKIVVTGASSGIGREAAIFLSRLGATVILVARNEEKLEETLSLMDGEEHKIYPFNLINIDNIERLVENIVKENGKLYGIVHCAGIGTMRPLKMTTHDFLHNVMLLNFYSFIELIRAFTKKSNNIGYGSIVVMSSISSDRGEKGKLAYCTSKAALDGSIRSMSIELAEKKIRINSIKAGLIETEMFKEVVETVGEERALEIIKKHPLGLGKTTDVANMIAYLLSDASKFITGTSIAVDGGFLAKE